MPVVMQKIKRKKRYITLIFGDGGSMNTVLFPLTPAITLVGYDPTVTAV